MAVPPVSQVVPQFDIHITYVDKEGPFIKIFAQIEKKNALMVERCLYRLSSILDSPSADLLKPKAISDISIGLLCCAKYEDGVYYRARIENLERLEDLLKVTVTFIDHGNKALVNVSDIRLMSKIVSMLTVDAGKILTEHDALATEHYLCGISPPEKEWDNDTLDFLKKKLCNQDVKCTVYELGGKKIIKILDSEVDPVSLLISANKAFPIPMHTQERMIKAFCKPKVIHAPLPGNFTVPPPSLLRQHPPPVSTLVSQTNPILSQPPPNRMGHEPNMGIVGLTGVRPQSVGARLNTSQLIRPGFPGIHVKRPEAPSNFTSVQSLQFSTEMLAPGSAHAIFVSHVEDGPHSFAVQLQSVVQEVLMTMMADLNNLKPEPITAPLNPGSICLGRFSNDGTLCRAIVMNVLDDKVKLYFADFGNSEILPYSDIYQIPSQFVTPKVMSHRFTLANIKDMVYSDHEKKIFKDLVSNSRELFMKVTTPEANPLKQYCELFLNFKNIKTILQEIVQAQPMKYTPLALPPRGSHEKVTVAYVVHPGRFFVQLDKNKFLLENIMSCVAKHCERAPMLAANRVHPSEPCCALFDDGTWYRAEIQSIQPDNMATINFVDYGNIEEIPVTNLRQTIPQLVTTVKAQALWCCLKGFELRYDVPEELSNRLEELILEQSLTMEVVAISNDTNVLIVELTDETGRSISVQLEAASAPPISQSAHRPAPAPTQPAPAHQPAADEWEETPSVPQKSSWEDRKQPDSRGQRFSKGAWGIQAQDQAQLRGRQPAPNKRPREEKKPWRTQEEGGEGRSSRFNKDGGLRSERQFNNDGDDKPWNKGREDSRGGVGRFNQSEETGSRFNREEKKYSSGRFQDGDRGSRFNEDRGGGVRYNRDDGGSDGTYNKSDGSSWRKRDDEAGSWRNNNKNEGNWKEDKGSGGGWTDGAGDKKSRFDSESGGFKKGGYNRDNQGERSSYQKPWERGGGDSYRKQQQKTPKLDTCGGMPHSTVKVGLVENVQVVFTTSISEFYIQLSRSFDELNDLMEKIATACENGSTPDMTDVQEKAGCLAKYSEDDSWYRGYVEEKSFDSAKILFVDYGNREDVPLDKIKILPEEMCLLPVQAIKCKLFGVLESADVETFKTIVSEKTLKTHFVGKHFLTNSFEVVLVDEENNSNVNAVMGAAEEAVQISLSKLASVSLSAITLSLGSTFSSQLTWYLSPSEFYLQALDTNAEFRAMMTRMQTMVRTGTPKKASELKVEDFVIARFKTDKVLYRARVKETGFAPLVQFVDYGNCELVESDAIWAMEPEFAFMPAQAVTCSLAAVTPVADTWPKPDTTELDAHFDGEMLEGTVLGAETDGESPHYLVRLTKNGADVGKSIVAAGLALAAPAPDVDAPFELDTLLLIGQLLSVSLLRVEADLTFYVKPAIEDAELASLEYKPGAGIKCSLSTVRENVSDEQKTQFFNIPADSHVIIRVDSVLSDGLQVTLFDEEGLLLPLQGAEILALDKVCPPPVLNTHRTVYISHADDAGIFLHKTSAADSLAELLQKLFDFYSESEQVDQEWSEGDLCCAMSVNDGQWYRAKIVEGGSEAKVFYLDYGNSETLPAANLRKLDPTFYTSPAFALKVSFHIKWTVPVANLLELAGETEYNGVVLRKNSAWVAELVDSSGQNLSEKLVELGFAVALENSPFKRIVEGGRFVKATQICVTVHCVDSPLQLWVNVVDDVELVDALQDRLQDAAPKLPSLKEPVGIFAVKYSDGQWYRAVKLDDTTVKFIDYGNTYTIDMANIKTLSPDFLDPTEGYAIKIELPIVNFKEEATKKLSDLLYSEVIDSEEEITAHILSVTEASIVADVFKGEKSVVDTLVEERLGTRVHKVLFGFVSHINNLNNFFVQEVGCEEPLEDLANIMLKAENFEHISEISVGDIVAALYPDDGLWYRAKVTQKSEEGIEALFIDYGNSAVVTDIKELPDDLSKKSAFSTQCALLLPKDVQEWSEQANNKFVEISADGCTEFNVKILNQECPASVIMSYGEILVAEQLKSVCKDECPEGYDVNPSPEGYNVTVYISHINDPNDFYVQPEDVEDELETMRAELADTSSFKAIDNLTEEVCNHRIVGALFDEDKLWYRAKLLNAVENGVQVLFVDYGNTAVATEFQKLPENLETKPLLAIHCSLGKKNWDNAGSQFFTELSGEGSISFRMKIVEDTEPKIVSLITEGKLVEEQLVSLFEETSVQIKEVTENKLSSAPSIPSNEGNSTENVFLIQVFSPSDFYLHTAEATQLIGEISERLIAAEDFPMVEGAPSGGDIVAAQFDEDDLWYRAKVLELFETETKVLFVDYGNTAKVAKMKNLPEDLISIPPLAMHCSLLRASDKEEWPAEAYEKFNTLANDEEVSFDMKVIHKGELNLVDLFINGNSVSELLGCYGLVPEKSKECSEIEHSGTSADEQTLESSDRDGTSRTQDNVNSSVSSEYISESTVKSLNDSLSLKAATSESGSKKESLMANSKIGKISHFNTCYDFYIQWGSDIAELNQITNEMSEAESFETMLDDDKILAAKNENGLWCRAKIIDMKLEASTVLFVDFGYTGLSQCFRKLPKHLAQIKPQSQNCCLSVPKEYEAIANNTMIKLAKYDLLEINKVVILEEKEPCVVDIIVCGQTLTDVIISKAKTADDILSEIIDSINEPKTDSEYMRQIADELVTLTIPVEESSSNLVANASPVKRFSIDLAASTTPVEDSSSDLITNASLLEETSCELVTNTTTVKVSSSDLVANASPVKGFSIDLDASTPLVEESSSDLITNASLLEETSCELVTNTTTVKVSSSDLVANASPVKEFSIDLDASTPLVEESSSDLITNASLLEETSCELVTNTTTVKVSSSDLVANASPVKGFSIDLDASTPLVEESSSDLITNASLLEETSCELVTNTTTVKVSSSDLVANASPVKEFSIDLDASTPLVEESSSDLITNSSLLEETSCELATNTTMVKEYIDDLVANTTPVKESSSDFVANASPVAESSSHKESNSKITNRGICDEKQNELIDNLYNENGDLTNHCNDNMLIKIQKVVNTENNGNANLSPSTPRRSNIDEHIVPGSISTTTLEEASEQS